MSNNKDLASAVPASGSHEQSPTVSAVPVSIPDADDDMRWVDVAVTMGGAFVIDCDQGFKPFLNGTYWEDNFQIEPPCAPAVALGAYRWHRFKVGFWGEDDQMNVIGGTLTPMRAQGIEARSGETERLDPKDDSPVACDAPNPEIQTLQAEVKVLREALAPFVAFADARDEKYRKRGGDPDAFPDKHPSYDIRAAEMPARIWRNARAALSPVLIEDGK